MFIYGLSEIGSNGGFSISSGCFLGFGVLSVAAFCIRSGRVATPLLDVSLFRDRSFASATMTSLMTSAAISSAMVLVPLYYQQVRGASPIRAALLLAPGAIGAMVSSQIAGRLTGRFPPRVIVFVGLVGMTIGLLIFTRVGVATNELLLAATWLFRGSGNGFAWPSLQAASYATLDREQFASASTPSNIVHRVGGAFGVALGAVIVHSARTQAIPRAVRSLRTHTDTHSGRRWQSRWSRSCALRIPRGLVTRRIVAEDVALDEGAIA